MKNVTARKLAVISLFPLGVGIIVSSQTSALLGAPPPVIQPPPSSVPTSLPPQTLGTKVVCSFPYTLLYPRSNPTIPKVLIHWQSTEFGDDYSPQQRCQIVSQRLQQAVDSNNGSISTLSLRPGTVSGRVVICYSQYGEPCNSGNMLLTLKRKNEGKVNDIIANLIDTKSTSITYENTFMIVPLNQFEDGVNPPLPDGRNNTVSPSLPD